MKKLDLEKILSGDVAHILEVDMHEPSDPKIEVVVLPMHLKNILLAYLDDKINEVEINTWAEFLCFRSGEYVSANWMDAKTVDLYEDMWHVVQKLSTPEIDGAITTITVKEYLKELEKYF